VYENKKFICILTTHCSIPAHWLLSHAHGFFFASCLLNFWTVEHLNNYRTQHHKWSFLPFFTIISKWCAWAICPSFVISSASFSQQNFENKEWEVEKILGNKKLSGKSVKYKFLVKWLGWSDSYNE